MAGKFVAYYRVSTKAQGKSGLGLEAQERDINLFLTQHGGELLDSFTDIQSGKDADRPALKQALALARDTGAPLLVAKLDRLSRSVAFIATLLDDKRLKVKVACMPSADTFQLHIYASLAQQEREFISQRTKAGLASAKARGVKLGNPRLLAGDADSAAKATLASVCAADEYASRVRPYIDQARAAGATNYYQIARALEARGIKTRRGGAQWSETQVQRIVSRT
jgi:DNA invertase Pin-like site-specific DNA recombinase